MFGPQGMSDHGNLAVRHGQQFIEGALLMLRKIFYLLHLLWPKGKSRVREEEDASGTSDDTIN